MTDLELITRVKIDQDGSAIKELIERHTGVYIKAVSAFSLPTQTANDVRQDKYFNIYQFALAYDPSRGMKFSSYVGERAKFLCTNLYNRAPESVTFNEEVAPTNDTAVEDTVNKHDDMSELDERAKRIGDPKFYEVFCARFGGDKPKSWREVGVAVDMTQEGARKLFNRHAYKLREYVTT